MKKYKLATLGCRTNQYESQAYQDQLEGAGFQPVSKNEKADICIVNTCTVTRSADSSSRNQIRSLIKSHPTARIVVTGCMVEKNAHGLNKIKGITDIVSNMKKEDLLKNLFPEEQFPEFSIKRFDCHKRAFVKVQDGCNSFCTYCIIPYVRGRSRSRSISGIIEEIQTLISNGYKEVVLTGINIGDFDGGKSSADEKDTLADLVKEVDSLPGLERIRISSIDPDEVDEKLLDAVLNGKKTCHSMHIVLQSGSNVVLKRMNRKYTRQMFHHTIDTLRSLSTDFTFTTDVIVGFPGESEKDFEQTLEVMEEVQFAKVHMFPYSPRGRTKAATYTNHIVASEMLRRKQLVLRKSEQYSYDLRERFIGQQMQILVEQSDVDGEIVGHTDNFLRVSAQSDTYQTNDLVNVKIIKNTTSGLIGQVIQ